MRQTKLPSNEDQKTMDEFFMREALIEAAKAQKAGDWPIGCVITINNRIVSRGRNKGYSGHNRLMHAELDAMFKAKKMLEQNGENATVYVTFEPCPMCVGALLLNHINRLVYGPNIDESGALHQLINKPKRYCSEKYNINLVGGILDRECREVFLKGDPTKKLIDLKK